MAGPLDTDQVTPGQDDKETTINDGNLHQDNASNTYLSIAMTDADYVLSAAEQQENIFLNFTGTLTADRNIDLLAAKHRQMTIKNSTAGGFNLIVRYAAGGSAVAVPDSEVRTIQATGSNVIEAGGGSGGGGGGSVSLTGGQRRASVYLTSSQLITDNASSAAISWDAADFDNMSAWSGSNASRLTVPAGANAVKLTANVEWEFDADGRRLIFLRKNGIDFRPQPTRRQNATGVGETEQGFASGPIEVSAGDYFEVFVFLNAAGNDRNVVTGNKSWFAMEVVDPIGNVAAAQTTDATATVIWSLPLAAGEHGNVTAQCSAKKSTDDESYTTIIQNSALNIAGTTTEQGSGEEVIAGPRSVGTPGAVSFKLIVNNTDDRIDLEWTGIAAETWDVLAVMTVTKL